MKCHNLKSSIHVSFGKMRYPVGHNSNKMIHSILDHLNFNDYLLTRRFVINKTLFSLKTHIFVYDALMNGEILDCNEDFECKG